MTEPTVTETTNSTGTTPEPRPCAGGVGPLSPSSLRAARRRVADWHARIQASPLGDLLGLVGLITALIAALFIAGGLQ